MRRGLNPEDRYRSVRTDFWYDPNLLALSRMGPSGQGLYLYLITGPHNRASLPGLFQFWPDQAAAILAWERSDVVRVMRELVASELARWSEASGICWIPGVFEYERPTSGSVAAAWAKEVRLLTECPLLDEAIASIDSLLQEAVHPKIYEDWKRTLGKGRDGGAQ